LIHEVSSILQGSFKFNVILKLEYHEHHHLHHNCTPWSLEPAYFLYRHSLRSTKIQNHILSSRFKCIQE
jgi:hypothetical protein